jgi:hypothetical protein
MNSKPADHENPDADRNPDEPLAQPDAAHQHPPDDQGDDAEERSDPEGYEVHECHRCDPPGYESQREHDRQDDERSAQTGSFRRSTGRRG